MTVERNFYKSAWKFISRNARPLDLARWRFHTGECSAEEVLQRLSDYQNADGGFGKAIEPDLWNPNSTPIGVWAASEILREIGFTDGTHPLVQGMLRYLSSGDAFSKEGWWDVVPSNNDYPHAQWYHCPHGERRAADHPTVSLAGFVLRFAKKNTEIYRKAHGIAVRDYYRFLKEQSDEPLVLRGYLELFTDCEAMNELQSLDSNGFRKKLYAAIGRAVSEKGESARTCQPSFFYEPSGTVFEIAGRARCKEETETLVRSQRLNGSLPSVGEWWASYKEAAVAENWSQSSALIRAMLFLRALG